MTKRRRKKAYNKFLNWQTLSPKEQLIVTGVIRSWVPAVAKAADAIVSEFHNAITGMSNMIHSLISSQ